MPAAPRLVLYRGTWAVYHQRRRYSTGHTGRAEAERFLAEFLAAQARPKAGADTVANVLAAYLATRDGPGRGRLEWAHKRLIQRLGAKPADRLTDADAKLYAEQRATDGVSGGTTRTELQALRAALKWRYGKDALAVPLPPRSEARERWLTRDEADRLLAACERPHIRLAILLGLHTGARIGAVLALTWDRVHLDRKLIDFREPGAARTRKRRVALPINDVLAPALAEAKERATSPYVIEFAGKRVARIKNGIAATAKRAGVAGVTPHVFRHTAATWMAQAGVDMWQIAGMLGHSDPAMVSQVYGHHHPAHMADAARALAGPRVQDHNRATASADKEKPLEPCDSSGL
jgi:integrase